MTKQCSKCKIFKEIVLFMKRSANKSNYGSWCKKCGNAYNRKHRVDYIEKHKIWERNQQRKDIKNLANHYIRDTISKGSSLQHKDIPNELVEIKREQLKILRLLRDN